MAVTFLVLFPLGASAIRILASIFQHNALAIHRALQLFNLVLVLIAMGLGIKACELNQTVCSPPFSSDYTLYFLSSHQPPFFRLPILLTILPLTPSITGIYPLPPLLRHRYNPPPLPPRWTRPVPPHPI